MGYFVAYRFTGADPEQLRVLMSAVVDALKNKGEDVYCTYFDEDSFQKKRYTPKDIFDHAFQKIDSLGTLFVVVDDEMKSEGMLIEVGYCLAKGYKITLAKKRGVQTHLDKLIEDNFEYNDIEDLVRQIKEQ